MRSKRTKYTMGPEYKICGHLIYAVKGKQSLAALQHKKLLSEAEGSILVKLSGFQA